MVVVITTWLCDVMSIFNEIVCLLNSTFTEFRKQSQQEIVYFPVL